MELFRATGKLKKFFFFLQLEMFDVCTTSDAVHIDTIFKLLPHTRQPHAPAAFTLRKYFWYSFSLWAESTPGPWYGRKEYVTEKSSDTTGNRCRDHPTRTQRLNHYATPGPYIYI